jgi:hypothetical protein
MVITQHVDGAVIVCHLSKIINITRSTSEQIGHLYLSVPTIN